MRLGTAPKVLLCICAVVGLSAGIGTGVAVYLQHEPVLLACPDVTGIADSRWNTQSDLAPQPWPLTAADAPPVLRRSIRRSKQQSLIAAPVPVEQCGPFPSSRAPGADDGAALHEVPEPSSASVAVLGLAGLAWVRRKKKAQP